MPLKPSYVDSFLNVLQSRDRDHWVHSRGESGTFWRATYSAITPPCSFFIQLTQQAICLQAPYNKLTIYPECRVSLYRHLLRLNEEMTGAKFGLAHNGDISLMVEWASDSLSYPTFEMIVELLLNYHRLYYSELQMVAQDLQLQTYFAQISENDATLIDDNVEIEVEK